MGGAKRGNLRGGLSRARNMFSRSRRKHASQILIVISASRSSGNIRSIANSMKIRGVSIFAVGIGRRNRNQLRPVCSSREFCLFGWYLRRMRRRQIVSFLSNLNNGTFYNTLERFISIIALPNSAS